MPEERTYVLAIDLGTGGPKVALVSASGEVVDYEFQETPLYLLPGGGAEQKPEEWWQAICAAAGRLRDKGLARPEEVTAVCCTSQWSGTVPVDRDGQPLADAIIWMDSRGAPHAQRITAGPLPVEGYGLDKLLQWVWLTGGIPSRSGKDSIAHILYLKHERPEIYQAAHKFLEPKDYINFRLTGQFAAAYDSISLHWVTDNRNIDRIVYDDRLLRLAGVERRQLPDLKRAVDVLGTVRPEAAEALGVSRSAQVVMGTPDLHSAALGSGAVRDYEPHLYIGTSSWLICHVPFKKTDLFHNIASLPSAIPGRYLLLTEQECAGVCLTYLRDQVFFADDGLPTGARPADAYRLFDRLAAGVPAGSDGLIFTPWMYGERTPVEDAHVRGAFFNQTLQSSRAHLVRAVMEGVAFNARWLLQYVEQFTGRRAPAIPFIGGGARSEVWCQILADVLDRPIRQSADPIQANARGAGFLALAALGRLRFEDLPGRVPVAREYAPNPDHRRVYDELFREFVDYYRRNRAAYARLNKTSVS